MSASYIVDLGNVVVAGQTILPQATDVAVSGTAVDFKEGQEPVNAICAVGAITGSGTGVTFTFEESADGSTNWAAPPQGAQSVTVLEGATTPGFKMFYRTKRYVRAVASPVGGGTANNISCTLLAQQIMTGGAYGGSTNLPQT